MNIMKLPLGRKLILGGGIVGILSLFFPWVDAGFVSADGFQQQGYIMLTAFIYPIGVVLMQKKLKFIPALISLILGIIAMFAFISSKSTNIFGTDVNMAASGMYIMIIGLGISVAGAFLENKKKSEQ